MARWVFNFRETECRELTQNELKEISARRSRTLLKKWLWALATVLLAVSGIIGVVLAADNLPWGWGVAIVATIAMFFAMDRANKCERFALLLRRAARLNRTTRFERSSAPPEIRGKYQAIPLTEEDEERFSKIWWENDERFEQLISAYLGHSPSSLDLLDKDAVLLWVEGKLVDKVHDLDVLQERNGA